jgi:hypothetical protein
VSSYEYRSLAVNLVDKAKGHPGEVRAEESGALRYYLIVDSSEGERRLDDRVGENLHDFLKSADQEITRYLENVSREGWTIPPFSPRPVRLGESPLNSRLSGGRYLFAREC